MSVPETESAQAAERAATAAAAAHGKADSPDNPRLPWHGKPRAADIFCWLGIVLSGVFYWALLPLRVSLVGTHPVVAELLNGSTESIISAAAFARAGDGTLAVVLLAAIPGLMKFDALFWCAGRLWGERFIMTLPIPRAIIGVIAGWAGMRLVTFLVLDLIGVLLWAGLLGGLGYALGHHAVVAARAISHYSWWFTIGIVALSVLLTVRSQRRLAAAPTDWKGG